MEKKREGGAALKTRSLTRKSGQDPLIQLSCLARDRTGHGGHNEPDQVEALVELMWHSFLHSSPQPLPIHTLLVTAD